MVKVTEMSDDTAKKMTNCISVISKTEDEKAQNDKEIKKLDREIVDLEAQIVKIREKKRRARSATIRSRKWSGRGKG